MIFEALGSTSCTKETDGSQAHVVWGSLRAFDHLVAVHSIIQIVAPTREQAVQNLCEYLNLIQAEVA